MKVREINKENENNQEINENNLKDIQLLSIKCLSPCYSPSNKSLKNNKINKNENNYNINNINRNNDKENDNNSDNDNNNTIEINKDNIEKNILENKIQQELIDLIESKEEENQENQENEKENDDLNDCVVYDSDFKSQDNTPIQENNDHIQLSSVRNLSTLYGNDVISPIYPIKYLNTDSIKLSTSTKKIQNNNVNNFLQTPHKLFSPVKSTPLINHSNINSYHSINDNDNNYNNDNNNDSSDLNPHVNQLLFLPENDSDILTETTLTSNEYLNDSNSLTQSFNNFSNNDSSNEFDNLESVIEEVFDNVRKNIIQIERNSSFYHEESHPLDPSFQLPSEALLLQREKSRRLQAKLSSHNNNTDNDNNNIDNNNSSNLSDLSLSPKSNYFDEPSDISSTLYDEEDDNNDHNNNDNEEELKHIQENQLTNDTNISIESQNKNDQNSCENIQYQERENQFKFPKYSALTIFIILLVILGFTLKLIFTLLTSIHFFQRISVFNSLPLSSSLSRFIKFSPIPTFNEASCPYEYSMNLFSDHLVDYSIDEITINQQKLSNIEIESVEIQSTQTQTQTQTQEELREEEKLDEKENIDIIIPTLSSSSSSLSLSNPKLVFVLKLFREMKNLKNNVIVQNKFAKRLVIEKKLSKLLNSLFIIFRQIVAKKNTLLRKY